MDCLGKLCVVSTNTDVVSACHGLLIVQLDLSTGQLVQRAFLALVADDARDEKNEQ